MIKNMLSSTKTKLKKNKKKIVIVLSICILLFMLVFSYTNLNNPTKLNAYIAHVINKGAPANNYFDDEIFYKAVVNAYNKKNKTSLPYTTNLTDSQLKNITSVSYDGAGKTYSERIKSTKGVEKLTALTLLNLEYNKITSIDLSKNTQLTYLNLESNNITSIDLSKNNLLTKLNLKYNKITSIDLSKNIQLTHLDLFYNNITSMDLSKNTKLTSLYLDGNDLTSIDLSKNTELTSLHLYVNNIRNIDLSKNTQLTYLSLGRNNITSIDLSKNTQLRYLSLGRNNITSIDLSKNTLLTSLDLEFNNITNIDLSKNTKLLDLRLNSNNITSIDLSQNTLLTTMYLYSNDLTSIDLSKNTKLLDLDLTSNRITNIDLSKNNLLTKLELGYNNITNIDLSDKTKLTYLDLRGNNISSIKLYDSFDISKINNVIGKQKTYQTSLDLGSNRIINLINDYKYYYSSKIIIPNEVSVETLINNLRLQNITAKVFNGDEEISNEKIKDGYTLKLYYNDKEIDSVSIKIFKNSYFDDEIFYKAVVDAYNKENKTSLPYTTSLTDDQLKSIKSVSYSVYNKSSSEKIKSTKGVEKLTALTYLNLERNNITSIDLSKNTELTSLHLSYNNITNVDLSKNTLLTDLGLCGNGLTRIDLSKNTSLTELYLYDNNIRNIDLSKNTKLTSLYLWYNNITSIDLSKNTLLKTLYLTINNITSIDLSKNTELTYLDLRDNNIRNIDLSKNTKLTSLYLDGNNITNIDLSKNTSLTELYLYDNNIRNIDLSKNTELTSLHLSDNNIRNIDLSKNTLLKTLRLAMNNITSIDLSENTQLTSLELYDNPLKINAYIKENGTLISSNIKMPKGSDKFYLTYDIKDNSIAEFTDGKLKGLKVGKTNATITLNGVNESSSSKENMKIGGIITVFDITSSKYKINSDEKYIYTKYETDSNTILSNIDFQYINGKIYNNELILYDGDIIVDKYKISNILISPLYQIKNNYIYVGNKSIDGNQVSTTNCTKEVKQNTLYIKYDDDILDSYKLTSISSDKYDLSKKYIYDNNFNINNIKVVNGSIEEKDNMLNIKMNNEIVDSRVIVKATSDTYDLSKDYIYIGKNELDESKFNLINCKLQVENNLLNIKYNNDVVKSYKLVKISSDTYDLKKNYIYIGNGVFNKNLLSVINGTINVLNDKIEIKYNNEILDEFKLLKYSSSTYDLNKEYIYLGVNNFNKNNINLVNLNLSVDNNSILNIKYDGNIMKTYKLVSISSSTYDLSKDNIRINKKDSFNLNGVNVINGTKEYLNNKLYIKYNNDVLKIYNIIYRSKGDINNDDKITISDVSKLFAYYKGKVKLTEDDLLVSDLNNDGKITNADISKLFAYYKGKIKEL